MKVKIFTFRVCHVTSDYDLGSLTRERDVLCVEMIKEEDYVLVVMAVREN